MHESAGSGPDPVWCALPSRRTEDEDVYINYSGFNDIYTAADLSYEPEDGLRRELHDGVV